jgi:hypothetical protein
MHDGFYFRANFGYGLTWASFDDAGTNNADVDADGSGIGIDLLIGGSPSPGIAVGGGLIGNWLFSAEFEQAGFETRVNRDIQSGLVGVFVDGFPRVSGGWHVGGLIGLAAVQIGDQGNPSDTTGFGGAVWTGYDQWVADDWALGGLVRFTATRTMAEDEPFDVTASHANLTFMFTALYH